MRKNTIQNVQIDCLSCGRRYTSSMLDAWQSRTISPRDLAKAVGVSESSVKRWVDQGRLQSTRTAGGHRRIGVLDALRGVRELGLEIRNPSILGVEHLVSETPCDLASPVEALEATLRNGDHLAAGQIVVAEFLSGRTMAEIADRFVRPAMQSIGADGHTTEGILTEHRATQILMAIVHTLRSMTVNDEPRFYATGGGLSGDPYQLPSAFIAGVLEDSGGAVSNIGPDTPIDVIRMNSLDLPKDKRPELVWISVSSMTDPGIRSEELNAFLHDCDALGVLLAVGGRQVGELSLDPLSCLSIHTSMASLSDLAAQLG